MDNLEVMQRVAANIDSLENELWGIATALYKNPETAFEEHQSSQLLSGILARAGFKVEMGVGGIDTAFRASVGKGNGEPAVAFLAEYDALPVIGHACGHNLIASISVGAGLAMVDVLDYLHGSIQVIGTPAEEGGGGKLIMKDAGVFDGLDAAMMVHPSSRNMVVRGSLASTRLKLEFFGKPAHAAALPEKGVNALEALLLTFNNINAMRQHLERSDRVAGIITNGGAAANIVPEYSSGEFSVRGATSGRREEVLKRVLACAEAGALATGCRLEYEVSPGYDNMIPNRVIGELFTNHLEQTGREVVLPSPVEPMGSTDMGNVSQLVPSLHPYIQVVGEDVAGHTEEFREGCISPAGRKAVQDGAKALAMTAVELLSDPRLVERAWDELRLTLHGGLV